MPCGGCRTCCKIVKVSIYNYKLQGLLLSQKAKNGGVPGCRSMIVSWADSFRSLSIVLFPFSRHQIFFLSIQEEVRHGGEIYAQQPREPD